MGLPNLKNFAFGELASSITNSGTSLSLKTGHGARFPASASFRASLMAKTYGNAAKAYHAGALERILVTAGHGTDTFTITRAQEGTSGLAFAADDLIFQAWSESEAGLFLPNEMTTRGDLIVRGASAPQRLALGADGVSLMSDGTDGVWKGIGGGDLWHSDNVTNIERWMVPGVTAVTPKSPSVGRLYAMPFFVSQPCTLVGLRINVTTLASGGGVRVGVYRSVAANDIYPGPLVVESAELDTSTTGVKTETVSQALTANRWHWVVFLCKAPAPAVTGVSAYATGMGVDSTFAYGNNLYVSQTYGALPSTFPGSPTWNTSATFPVVGMKISDLV